MCDHATSIILQKQFYLIYRQLNLYIFVSCPCPVKNIHYLTRSDIVTVVLQVVHLSPDPAWVRRSVNTAVFHDTVYTRPYVLQMLLGLSRVATYS